MLQNLEFEIDYDWKVCIQAQVLTHMHVIVWVTNITKRFKTKYSLTKINSYN